MNKYKYGLLVTIITGMLSCVGQRSVACCTPPDMSIPNWLLWVVPNHELCIPAYEYSCVCLWDWGWEFPSGMTQTYEYWEAIPWSCRMIYWGCFRFSDVNEYDDIRAWASCCCDPNIKDSDYARVYAVEMGFSVGRYLIPVNDDDDDANGRMDHDNGGPPPSDDDDLVPVLISVDSPRGSPDRVQLLVERDMGALQIWEYQDPNTICLIGATDPNEAWFPGRNWSKTLYAEGKRASRGQLMYDPRLYWDYHGYTYSGDPYSRSLHGWTEETQSNKWLTVVHVDMDMDDVIDDHDSNPGITEETTPGGFIRLHGFKTLTVKHVNPLQVEDQDPGSWPVVTLSVEGASEKIWIWDKDTMEILALPATFFLTEDKTLLVEGREVSSAIRDITLVLTHNVTGFQDKINLTVVRMNVEIDNVPDDEEVDPGLYINVNWDDDDGDGWTDNKVPPDAVYTPDKDDSYVYDYTEAPNGDNDLRHFRLYTEPAGLPGRVKLTYSGTIAVYEVATKEWGVPSGFEYLAENLPIDLFVEGVSGSTTFRDAELKATYLPCGAEDVAKITVFEVDLIGLFGYGDQQSDNDKKMSTFHSSSDKVGIISWDDANGDGTKGDYDTNCWYFHNCMECQGTVKPSGVTTEVQFDLERESCWRGWEKLETDPTWDIFEENPSWHDDDFTETDEDKTPSASNHIYHIDAPRLTVQVRGPTWDYLFFVANLMDRARVNIDGSWYQCSGYHKWHATIYVMPKDPDPDLLTRDSTWGQQLGSGWIALPENP